MAHFGPLVGLTQRPKAEALGVASAADRHLAPLLHELNEDASGKDDDRIPELVGIGPTALGITHNVKVLSGQTLDQYTKAAAAPAEIWQVESVRVQRGEPGRVSITPVTADPLAEVLELLPDSLRPAMDLDFVPLGMSKEGGIWILPLDQTSTVFGGVPGAGKSVAINVLLANFAHRDDIQIIGMDMKGGLELGDWSPRLQRRPSTRSPLSMSATSSSTCTSSGWKCFEARAAPRRATSATAQSTRSTSWSDDFGPRGFSGDHEWL